MKKRIISMVLAILMICTIVSESIFAEVVGGNSTEVRYAKVETSSYFYVGMTPGAMEQMAGAVDFAKRLVITDETTNSSGTTYYQLSAAENYSWPTTIEGGIQKLTDGVWVKADYVTILKYCDICKDYDCGIEHPTEPEPTTEPVEPSDPTDATDPVEPSDPTGATDPVEPSDPVDPSDPVTPPAEDSVSAGVTDKDGNAVLDAKGEPLVVTVEGDLPEGAVVSAVVPEVNGEMLPNVFDIKVLVPDAEGNMVEWQPIDENKTVTISIPVMEVEDGGFVNVYHFIDYAPAIEGKNDIRYYDVSHFEVGFAALLANAEAISSHEGFAPAQVTFKTEVTDETVQIETDSFSIYHYDGTQYVLKDEQAIQVGAFQDDNSKYYFVTRGTEIFADTGWVEDLFSWAAKFEWSVSDSSVLKKTGSNETYEVYTVDSNAQMYTTCDITVKAKVFGATLAQYTSTFVVMPMLTLNFVSNTGHELGIPSRSGIFMGNSETHDPASNQFVALNETLTLPTPPPGYTIDPKKAWYVAHESSKFFAAEETIYLSYQTLEVDKEYLKENDTCEVTLVANFEPISYTITWVNNGVTTTSTYQTGETVKVQPPDEREGWIFVGWRVSTDDSPENWTQTSLISGTSEFTDKYGNVTLTADWVEASGIPYKVQHYFQNVSKNGYEMDPIVDELYGTTGENTNAESVKRIIPGFTFESAETKTIAGDGSTVVAIYYTRNDVTITFDSLGGTEIGSITAPYGTIISAPGTPPEKQYHVFGGWYSTANPNVNYQFSTMPAEDLTLYARWNVKQNTVTFRESEGGNPLYVINGAAGTSFEWPTTAKRIGYYFVGWNTPKFDLIPDEPKNTDVIAIWEKITYSISYLEKSGSGITTVPGVSPNPLEIDINGSIDALLPTPIREGYTFGGWYRDADCTGEPYTSYELAVELLQRADSANISHNVYAKWTLNEHNVLYTGDGITEHVSKFVYGATVTAETPADRQNYDFVGWSVTGLDGVTTLAAGATFIMPDNTVTLTAQWEVKSYTITWKVDDEAVKTESYNYGAVLNVNHPDVGQKTGYSFSGWSQDVPTTMPANDVIITAQWKVNQYTITFDTDDGSKIDPITQDYNSAVTAPADPTKTGYTFTGWLPALPDKMPAGNITVKAQWKVQSYTITWNAGLGTFADGTKEKQTSADHGSTPVAPEIPRMSKTGYTCTFAAWEPTINAATGAVTYTATYTESVNSYNYTVKTYTMGTNGQYGEPTTQTFSANYNTLVSITPEVRTGFTVASASTLSGTIPADNGLVLTVYYSRNEYSVTYKVDGEQYGDIDKVFYGSQVAIRQEPTTTGYTFTGWKINGEDAENFTMPANDVTITAQWKINQYTISFNTDGGSKIDPITQDYNSAVTAPADPTKTGYTFAGWDRAIPATMPANNVTITAKWRVNAYTYNVVYKSESGIVLGNAQVTRNFNTTDTITPRDFTGYTTPASQTVVWDNVNSKTITFTYKPVVYKISYELKGGVSGNNPASYTIESNDITLISPTKVGYEFLGWTGTGISDKTPEVKIAKGSIGDRSYTAAWGVDVSATIDNDGTIQLVHNSTTRTWTGSLTAENVEEGAYEGGKLIFNAAEGYKITKVLINDKEVSLNQADLITEYEIELTQGVKTECKDIKVTTEKIIVRLDIVIGSGSTQRVVKVMVNSDIIIAVTPPANEKLTSVVLEYADGTKTTVNQLNPAGYVFTSANITQDMRIVVGATTENVHFSIGSVEKGYVELKYGDTTINSTVSAPNPPCLPVGTDYTFKLYSESGYYIDKINDMATSEMPTTKELGGKAEDGLVYIAESNPFVYNISYNLDGGVIEGVDNPATYTVESESFTLNNPVKKGYFFQGWTGTDLTEKTQTVNVAKGSIGNREYTAIWGVNQYTITFHSNGGTEIVPIIREYGDAVTAPADPAKTGHSFDAWYTDPELTQKYVFSTMPAKDITLYAKWKINQYTITFNTDGGTEIIPITQDYDTVVTAPAAPEKDGYTFVGWYSNAELTQSYTIDKMPANDIALYAKWELALTDLVINTVSIDENQSFVFIVSAQGTAKGDIKLRVALNGTDTIVIKDLPVGEYTVTPVGGWAWRQSLEEQRIDVDGSEDVVTFKWTLVNALTKWLNSYFVPGTEG